MKMGLSDMFKPLVGDWKGIWPSKPLPESLLVTVDDITVNLGFTGNMAV